MENQTQEIKLGDDGVDHTYPIQVETRYGNRLTFTIREIRFLDEISYGISVEKAAKAVRLDWQKAYALLKEGRSRVYLGEREWEEAMSKGFTQTRWISEGLKVWRGEKKVDRQQMIVWQELGARVMPKAKERSEEKGPTININIGALEEASRRIEVAEVEEAKIIPEGEAGGSDDES